MKGRQPITMQVDVAEIREAGRVDGGSPPPASETITMEFGGALRVDEIMAMSSSDG
jgi:hypothetical protein